MTVVLDASAAASWILPDESGAESLLQIPDRPYCVPAVFGCEIVHLLSRAERRSRISDAAIKAALGFLASLPIEVVHEEEIPFVRLRETSQRFGINAYDAAYLELARRRSLPLATLDERLSMAAQALGISVLP